jgi:hypothetical protein
MKVERTYSEECDKIKAELLKKLKEHLRLTVDDFDSELSGLLDAAIETAEKETGCVFLPSQFKITSKTSIEECGYYPADEATSLKIDGVETDLERVHISGGKVCVHTDEGKSIEVVFDAGYLVMPSPVFIAVFLMAGSWWQNPTDSVETLPKASTNLLKNYRRWLR